MQSAPISRLFPYTTLFRSRGVATGWLLWFRVARMIGSGVRATLNRSEEHTSELQSRGHLVCRLLLEKKTLARVPQQAQTVRGAEPVIEDRNVHACGPHRRA